jgi:hypothetical protein
MPLTIFDVKGVPGNRRKRIETAVITGGKHVSEPYEGWIIADPLRGAVKVVITGAHGFQREVLFAPDEEPAVITERARATFEE